MSLESHHLQLNILAQAELVRVEGMKAENKIAELEGRPLPYGEDDFHSMANAIEIMAREFS
jgi:hypothetical protein